MPKKEKNQILITGAAGMLGDAVTREFQQSNWLVTKLLRSQVSATKSRTNTKFIIADITDRNQLEEKLGDQKYHACIHCAAETNLAACEKDPALAQHTHVLGTRNLVDIVDCDRFVYISTDSVFDGARGGYSEQDTPRPMNVYSRTKLEGETEASLHPRALIARLNLFDIRQQGGNTLAEWAHNQFATGQTITGFDNTYFNPLHTSQIANTIRALVDRQLTGTVHIGCTEYISKLQFLQRLAETLGYPDALVRAGKYRHDGQAPARPLNTTLNISKLQAILPAFNFDLATGLHKIAKTVEKRDDQQAS